MFIWAVGVDGRYTACLGLRSRRYSSCMGPCIDPADILQVQLVSYTEL